MPPSCSKSRLAALAATLMLGLPAVQAQTMPAGWYAGASAGQTRVDDMNAGTVNRALAGQGLSVRTVTVDDTASAWKAFVGYRFNDPWALEVAYTDLGRYRFDGQVTTDPGTVSATWKAHDWNVLVLGSIPLTGRLNVYGKLGVGWWHAALDAAGTFAGAGARSAASSGTGWIWGIGLQFPINPRWTVRAEWERFLKIGKATESGRADVDLLSAGLQYQF